MSSWASAVRVECERGRVNKKIPEGAKVLASTVVSDFGFAIRVTVPYSLPLVNARKLGPLLVVIAGLLAWQNSFTVDSSSMTAIGSRKTPPSVIYGRSGTCCRHRPPR